LIATNKPESSVAGIAVSGAALIAMPVLGVLKRRTGRTWEVGWCSLTPPSRCSAPIFSATVLVGLVLNAAFGWWWADPVAALAVVPLVIKEGVEAFQDEEEN
jgi:divalent metal cation (Fe/Co/Zn/Cd) transporter